MQCLLPLILLLFSFSGKVLVLKNGKSIRCDAYEVHNGKVKVYRDNEQFALPEALINWAKTEQTEAAVTRSDEAARARLKEKRERKRVSEASDISRLMDIYDEKQRKEQTSLTTADKRPEDKSTVKASSIGKHSFRKWKNSIIVAVYVNESGPFDFQLNTGASITMISDGLASRLMLNRTLEVPAGEGGAGRVATSWLNSLSLESTSVGKMIVLIQDIPALHEMGVHGVLGQDFLSHFIMSVDTANQTLTLKPNGADVRSDVEIASNLYARAHELDSLFKEVGNLTMAYTKRQLRQDGLAVLSKQNTLVGEIREALSDFKKMLERRDSASAVPGNGEAAKLLKCLPQLEQALIATRKQISLLKRLYNEKDLSKRLQVTSIWKKVTDNATQFNTCRGTR